MKTATLFVFAMVGMFAQEVPHLEPSTKLEAFTSNKGKMLIRERTKVGNLPTRIGEVNIFALVLHEPGHESEGIKGFQVELKESGRLDRSHVCFLDLEEIAAVSQSLAYMSKLAEDMPAKEYTEVSFTTKGEFQIGFVKDKAGIMAFASSGPIGRVVVYLQSSKTLDQAKKLFDSGIVLLNPKAP